MAITMKDALWMLQLGEIEGLDADTISVLSAHSIRTVGELMSIGTKALGVVKLTPTQRYQLYEYMLENLEVVAFSDKEPLAPVCLQSIAHMVAALNELLLATPGVTVLSINNGELVAVTKNKDGSYRPILTQ